MSKITIMKGLPASGKSTIAKETIEQQGNTFRINKDLLRTMLHFDKFNYKNEEVTSRCARALALALLKDKKNVIIDDTNLNEKTLKGWKQIAHMANAKIEYGDMTHVDLLTCIARDAVREKRVGKDVIVNMAVRSGLHAFKGPVVICDLDGTLCDTEHRQHYMKGEKKDWKGFYSKLSLDPVREHVRKTLIQAFNMGACIVYVSGRPETYKTETLEWLKRNRLDFNTTIIMREHGDNRPDDVVKQEILDTYFNKEDIACVIDDRPRVIRMWKANGLKVIDVGNGIEF